MQSPAGLECPEQSPSEAGGVAPSDVTDWSHFASVSAAAGNLLPQAAFPGSLPMTPQLGLQIVPLNPLGYPPLGYPAFPHAALQDGMSLQGCRSDQSTVSQMLVVQQQQQQLVEQMALLQQQQQVQGHQRLSSVAPRAAVRRSRNRLQRVERERRREAWSAAQVPDTGDGTEGSPGAQHQAAETIHVHDAQLQGQSDVSWIEVDADEMSALKLALDSLAKDQSTLQAAVNNELAVMKERLDECMLEKSAMNDRMATLMARKETELREQLSQELDCVKVALRDLSEKLHVGLEPMATTQEMHEQIRRVTEMENAAVAQLQAELARDMRTLQAAVRDEAAELNAMKKKLDGQIAQLPTSAVYQNFDVFAYLNPTSFSGKFSGPLRCCTLTLVNRNGLAASETTLLWSGEECFFSGGGINITSQWELVLEVERLLSIIGKSGSRWTYAVDKKYSLYRHSYVHLELQEPQSDATLR